MTMATATPRVRLSGAERSEQLLDVAEELFIAKGFDRTSVEDIARSAGVSRPIVYQHHGSKEGVYIACLARARRRLVADYAAALEGLTHPHDILRAAATVWFTMVERDPDRWMLLFGTGIPLTEGVSRSIAQTHAMNTDYYRRAVEQWVHPDVSPDQAAMAAQMVASMGSQLAQWWLANRHIPHSEVVDQYADFCWNGLRPLVSGSHHG